MPAPSTITALAAQKLQGTLAPRPQRTIKNPVELRGVGLHSGKEVRMVIKPAEAGHGHEKVEELRAPARRVEPDGVTAPGDAGHHRLRHA